ncbi:fork head domain-containing protein [Sporodiniella umbellata]|nr:fork head domain-containing protein [Sporodiniella umbellata]
MTSSIEGEEQKDMKNYLPSIPVILKYPSLLASVKRYQTESLHEHSQHHIVPESFIPVAPNVPKPPRKRRRPPFSYSSLIAQAILDSENERMTLRNIYKWIINKYPSLYTADDTGWQNTIRHNLSLNQYFKKVSKDEFGERRGKGGYWTIDPSYMDKFKNGAFVRGASSLMRKKSSLSPLSTYLPDTPVSMTNNAEPKPFHAMQINNLLN